LLPEKVKKYRDREYYPEEAIAIEDKEDVRGLAVSGMMRGSGVRRGAEGTVSIGDLFPRQTEFGKIYKIWVYRGTGDQYPTACIPEVAKRFDDYHEYRLRFGEVCKSFGKDHTHEYHDGEEVTQKSFKADDPHLDPEAPLIREDFDKRDMLHVKNPRRLTDERISDIIREAAIAAGIRVVNKGQKNKRHKVMIAHGFRKLFKKRCRQAGMDPIILERFMGGKSGNPTDGVSKLMLTYDPEDWQELEQFFIKAIPHLTITKDAKIQAELEIAKEKLKDVPQLEKLQAEIERLKAGQRVSDNATLTVENQFVNKIQELENKIRLLEGKPQPPQMTDEQFRQFIDEFNLREYGTTDLDKIKAIVKESREKAIDREITTGKDSQ
jgi:hypothetical protein